MDALWMLKYSQASLFFSIFTIVSGLALCFEEKRPVYRFTHYAVLSWILMNATWLASEYFNNDGLIFYSKLCLVISLVFLGMSYFYTKSFASIAHSFKRFRINPKKEAPATAVITK